MAIQTCPEVTSRGSDEDAAIVRDAVGDFNPQLSIATSRPPAITKSSLHAKDVSSTLDESGARRQRLLELYLSERRYIVKTCEYVVFAASFQSTSAIGNGPSTSRSGWLERTGQAILKAWNIHGHVRDSQENIFVTATKALITRVQALENGSGWFQNEGAQEELEAAFARSQTLEMIHIMQIMLVLLESSTKLSCSDAILAWFRFMATYGFFDVFEPVRLQLVVREEEANSML